MKRAVASALSVLLTLGVCAPAGADDHDAHHHPALAGAAPVPGESLYQLEGRWTDARARSVSLAELRGSPVLIALFYGTCDSVCPTLVRDLQKLEALLPPEDRARTRFALVTIDPAVDTPERLRAYADEHGLDLERWALLHGTPEQVRTLAHALGVRYRPTGTGQYSHTIRITLLDREGVVALQADGLERPLAPLAARVSELLSDP